MAGKETEMDTDAVVVVYVDFIVEFIFILDFLIFIRISFIREIFWIYLICVLDYFIIYSVDVIWEGIIYVYFFDWFISILEFIFYLFDYFFI